MFAIRRVTGLRLLAGAMLLLALFGLVTALSSQVRAGAVDTVVVNSTGDDDDGDCEGPPNDNVVGGDCTLREAINAVNDGLADIIAFHPPVFPKGNPGVINIEDADGTGGPLGCLPTIARDGVTIDSQATGVIIDGDRDNDGTPIDDGDTECDDGGALEVELTNNGFDFTILGGKNLTIREFDLDAIHIHGDESDDGGSSDENSLGDLLISGVIIEDITGDGIHVSGVREITHAVITNNDITSFYPNPNMDDGEDAVLIEIDHDSGCGGCTHNFFDHDQVIDVTDNQLFGHQEGVDVELDGDLGNPESGFTSKASINVSDNANIDVDEDGLNGVDIEFDDGCIFKSAFNADVNGNGRIEGGNDDAVRIDVDGTPICENENGESQRATIDVSVSDNGVMEVLDGPDSPDDRGDGVNIAMDICCGNSQSSATVVVDDNDDIIGADDGVDIEVGDDDFCCGDENTSSVSVSGNGEITGEDDEGVELNVFVGDTNGGSGDSDGNISDVVINDNDEVTGVGADGIFVDNETGTFGGGDGSGDENVATVEISGNGRIDGDLFGIEAFAWPGASDGEADDNVATITVSENEQVDGGTGDGAYLDAEAGTLAFFDTGTEAEGDDNVTTITVADNDRFSGNEGDGIHAFSFAGGDTLGSERNTTNLTVTGNGDIEGEGTDFDGIHIDSKVCCSERKSNTNNVTISDNVGDIIGHDDDGIGFDQPESPSSSEDDDTPGLCCTVSHNVVTITDNSGEIRGGDDAGIDYDVNIDSITCDSSIGGPSGPCEEDSDSGDLDADGLFSTVNILTISGNNLINSGRDGIEICCGAFEAADQGKSVISNNVINHNADHGIEIDSSFGLNIGPNNIISDNGDDESVDAGIEIDNETTMSDIGDFPGGGGIAGDVFAVPANHNTITQNSIFDNTGLGIDLASDPDDDDGQNTGPEDDAIDELTDGDDSDGNSEHDHGVGCTPKDAPISPNDCLPHPVLQTQAGNKLVGHACSRCTVEVFWADPTPADQTGGDEDQHEGEEHGEGVDYIVSGEADADGNFSIQLPCGLGTGELTATATDKVKNTSEFANNQPTLGTSSCATPTFTPTNTVPPTNTPLPTNTFTPAPPTNTPLPPATPTPAKDCGDVDDSGEVNSIDAQLILQLKAGLLASLPNEASADANGDGDITSVDALLILQRDAGLIGEDVLVC